jgi:hypothetical protein
MKKSQYPLLFALVRFDSSTIVPHLGLTDRNSPKGNATPAAKLSTTHHTVSGTVTHYFKMSHAVLLRRGLKAC